MHPRLEGWLQKRLKQKKKKKEDDDDSPSSPCECTIIPKLPSPRPRPITPTPDNNGLTAQPQTLSRFFSRLPLEIRQLVYTHLFGNRVVHVELGYQYPRKPGGIGHAGWGTAGLDGCINYRNDQSSGEKRWVWQCSGCCRDPECCWWDDGCIVGRGTKCSSSGGGGQVRDCIIDASWLLVCRRGYLESVDILYSTNTFHLGDLSALLPRTGLRKNDDYKPEPPNQLTLLAANLLPHRFAQLSRLNVRAYSPHDPPHPSYARLCRTPVLLLPALHELRLAVQVRSSPRLLQQAGGPPAPDGRRIVPALDEAAWLGVVDEMVAERRLGFVEFVVGQTWWEVFDRRGGEVVQGDGGGEYRRFWRVVEEGNGVEGGGGLGYWVAGMPDYCMSTIWMRWWSCGNDKLIDAAILYLHVYVGTEVPLVMVVAVPATPMHTKVSAFKSSPTAEFQLYKYDSSIPKWMAM
ncbi:hypothetical protein DIS24_g11821 [Lasiodiplodia hormozganensis]|uniref:DUF7730 domain-containing protein n=1 Tax=Lasiodiplodia hormozganensis TaxID=869390 RepID=A0AA39WHE6_9PEZI|nr:hypothetical protein DIS24_g11821 [Lasiodiplodia hormozganensis]